MFIIYEMASPCINTQLIYKRFYFNKCCKNEVDYNNDPSEWVLIFQVFVITNFKNQFHTRATPFQPQKSLSSTLKTPQFLTKNPSVQHNPLSSTPKPLGSTPLSSTRKTPQFHPPSVPHQNLCLREKNCKACL